MPELTTNKHKMKDHRLTAIMFTDIVGYTTMMGRDEGKTHELMSKNRNIHQSRIRKYNGILQKEIGDGMMASFPAASNAVFCALEIQLACQEENIPLRIGIHQGEVIFENNDILGDGVNIASRIEQAAEPGSIYISASVFNDIRNKPEIQTEYVEEKRLKNVENPQKIYNVRIEESIIPEWESIEEGSSPMINWKVIVSVLIGLTALILIVLYIIPEFLNKPPKDLDRSIAVLPFDNESADESNIYFVNGMMEDIRNNLAKIGDLHVISKTSTEKYRDTKLSIRDIANELEVNYVLEGTVFKAGNKVRIFAQLIETKSDDHVWVETYNRDLIDIFIVQSEIAQAIANNLHAIITPTALSIIESIPSNNISAYDIFLRARDQHNQYWLDNTKIEAFEEAILLYHRALEFDSAFAKAYTGLALAFLDKHKYLDYLDEDYLDSLLVLSDMALSYDSLLDEAFYVKGRYYGSQEDGFNESLKNYNKALDLNPNYAEVYRQKSTIAAWVKEDYIEAIKNDRMAIKLDHSILLPNTLRHISDLYLDIGLFGEAKKSITQAFYIDNDSVIYFTKLAWIHMGAGEFQEGFNVAYTGYQLDSMNVFNLITLLMLSSSLNDIEQGYYFSVKLINFFEMVNFTTPNDFHRFGYFFWQKGYHKKAEYFFNEQTKYCEESIRLGRNYANMYGAQYDMACILAFKGEEDRALQLLGEINDKKGFFNSWFITQFENEPFFEALRDDERYRKILGDMKSKYRKEQMRVQQWLIQEGHSDS